jgi:hypothetical protein
MAPQRDLGAGILPGMRQEAAGDADGRQGVKMELACYCIGSLIPSASGEPCCPSRVRCPYCDDRFGEDRNRDTENDWWDRVGFADSISLIGDE